MTQAEQIRQYVINHFIQPARTAGEATIKIQAATIHTQMQLENRVPNVCSSLDAQKFYEQASVTLVKRSGPKQSSTAEWVLALGQVNAMDLENQTPVWERTHFTFNGTELQLIEVVERYIHTLPGTRKIDFHLSWAERPIHIRQTTAWLEEQDFDLAYEDSQTVEKKKFVRAVWIGKGEKEYLNESAQSEILAINYRYMAIRQPWPLPDFLPSETYKHFQSASVGLAIKISKQTSDILHGFVERVPLMNKAAVGIIESIQQWNKQVQTVTNMSRWSATIDIDLESFDYRFEEGLSEIFSRYSLANQCYPVRRKITKAKILYIFHWKPRKIQFSATLIKHTKGTVKVQIEQYPSAPHSPEYIRSRIDDIIGWIHREFEVQLKEERGGHQSTLGIQMPDRQLIYENTTTTATLNDWLRSFFQENRGQMWEVYNGMLSWSIERDIVNPIDPSVDTKLIIAEFKVIPILYVESFPINEYSTLIQIYLGAERLNASMMQSIIKQALEPANAESAKPDKGNRPTGRPIKILFLAANPLDTVLVRTDEEKRAIDAALRQAANRNFEISDHGAVRIDDLQDLLLRHQPDIVHFSGHGTEENELILIDANGNGVRVSGDALRQLFTVLKGNIRCIVLNACYTEAQAKGLAEVIDYVVGIDNAISDEAARQFATAFYRGLGYDKSIADAFDLGKVQVELAGLGESSALHLLTRTGAADTFTFATDSSNQSKPLVTPPPQSPTIRGTMKQG